MKISRRKSHFNDPTEVLLVKLANALKKDIKESDKTLEDIAALTGTTPQYLTNLLNPAVGQGWLVRRAFFQIIANVSAHHTINVLAELAGYECKPKQQQQQEYLPQTKDQIVLTAVKQGKVANEYLSAYGDRIVTKKEFEKLQNVIEGAIKCYQGLKVKTELDFLNSQILLNNQK